MKNYIKKILLFILIFLLTLSLTACGIIDMIKEIEEIADNIDDTGDDEKDPEHQEEQGKDPETKKSSFEKFVENNKSKGISIAFKTSEDSDDILKIGFKNDIVWMINGENSGFAGRYVDGVYNAYQYNEERDAYIYEETIEGYEYTEEDINSLAYTIGNVMFGIVDGYDMEKVGSDTVLGRKCTKYVYEINVYTAKATYTAWIDDEYDICMKVNYKVVTVGGEVNEEFTEEVTEFIVGSSVEVPKFIEGVKYTSFNIDNFKITWVESDPDELAIFEKVGNEMYFSGFGYKRYYKAEPNGDSIYYRVYEYTDGNWIDATEEYGVCFFDLLEVLSDAYLYSNIYDYRINSYVEDEEDDTKILDHDTVKFVYDDYKNIYFDEVNKFIVKIENVYDGEVEVSFEIKSFDTSINALSEKPNK